MLLRHAIGHCLRQFRARQGRTLRDVASAAGVSVAHLSAIERGESEASSEVLAALCDALGVSMAELLEELGVLLPRSGGPASRSAYRLAA